MQPSSQRTLYRQNQTIKQQVTRSHSYTHLRTQHTNPSPKQTRHHTKYAIKVQNIPTIRKPINKTSNNTSLTSILIHTSNQPRPNTNKQPNQNTKRTHETTNPTQPLSQTIQATNQKLPLKLQQTQFILYSHRKQVVSLSQLSPHNSNKPATTNQVQVQTTTLRQT